MSTSLIRDSRKAVKRVNSSQTRLNAPLPLFPFDSPASQCKAPKLRRSFVYFLANKMGANFSKALGMSVVLSVSFGCASDKHVAHHSQTLFKPGNAAANAGIGCGGEDE